MIICVATNSAAMNGVNNFWWIILLSYVLAQDPIVNLPQGRVVGIKVYLDNYLTPIEIFLGIPYATPPIGRYRFSAPERAAGWKRTFFAHRMPPKCPQSDAGGNDYTSEDCLFLNVWTPRRADGKTLPVAVILYSESWERAGANLPCQELASEGVVVVTVAYRLHLLSFFSLGSPAARGNLALLDQYMALLWVRDNIAAFGGNPTSITLIGHSAGADSVLYHMASPRTIGLFQRAILMSPRDIWKALDKQMDANATDIVQLSRLSAHALGCTGESDQEILHCMRTRPAGDIVSLYSKANWSTDIKMQPTPDYFLPDTEQYLPVSLSSALSLGKQPMQVDLLLGNTDLEAIFNNGDDYEDLLKRGASRVTDYANAKVIPELFTMFSLQQSAAALPLLAQAIRWEYFGPKSRYLDRETLDALEALARMQTAAKWGASGALLAARLARHVSRLFVYRYSQPAGVDLKGRQFNFTGAVHGSDIVSLLGDALMLQVARRPATPQEKRISSVFRKYIANFVKFGAPAAEEEWQRYKAGDAHVQDICLDCNSDYTHSHNRDVAFWLQYIPQLSNTLTSSEHSEQLTSDKGEGRLRGGVFAMSGVTAVLLLLLLACAILLHRQRTHRTASADNSRL